MAMPRGRPKGSTGIYSNWPPEKIAELLQDADLLASRQGRFNALRTARLLKEHFPQKYGFVSEDHLRQQLTRIYQRRKRKLPVDELDAFNAAVLAHLLGEKK